MPLYERSTCCNAPVNVEYEKVQYLGKEILSRATRCKKCRKKCEAEMK